MTPIEIRNDSKLVKLIVAQANGERVDSDQAEKAGKLIAEEASHPAQQVPDRPARRLYRQ